MLSTGEKKINMSKIIKGIKKTSFRSDFIEDGIQKIPLEDRIKKYIKEEEKKEYVLNTEETPVIFFDTETSGFKESRLVQLAYKELLTGDIFEDLFNPGCEIEEGAIEVHGINKERLKGKVPFYEHHHYEIFKEKIQNSILVAHNSPFDIRILKNEGINTEDLYVIDTLRVARHILPDQENHKLQHLRESLNLEVSENVKAHDALGDVIVLEELFIYLKNKIYIETGENKNNNDLIAIMLQLSKMPVSKSKRTNLSIFK